MIESKRIWGIVLAAALAAGGCVGSGAPGVSSDQLLVDEGEELGAIEPEACEEAESGCEGLLARGVQFAIVSAEFGLIAAVESDGDVVCVDTVEAVEEELSESGRIDEAHDLVRAFEASLTPPTAFSVRAGDPDPEPNLGFHRVILRGDPDPEPNSVP
ncbi:hypothetical protein [Sandaracinus amylolyticus]|uniref:Lipoprotein n=1 Tax=Sandaracinus amylolyticus TaxID=927083 RepID=A0A0F6SF84_9BACT|nr:hypothetical protein [Sandaracinus amylolyticus]AKF06499.1 hypothetical protein DB32_003648 [Sandaracinus amylolyticus]